MAVNVNKVGTFGEFCFVLFVTFCTWYSHLIVDLVISSIKLDKSANFATLLSVYSQLAFIYNFF